MSQEIEHKIQPIKNAPYGHTITVPEKDKHKLVKLIEKVELKRKKENKELEKLMLNYLNDK